MKNYRLFLPTLLLFLPTCLLLHAQESPLFRWLPPTETGVDFTNMVMEDDSFNVTLFIYAYNGGGVAVGDLNGDTLPDLYFTGTRANSPNRLFLNQGGLRFREASRMAGVDDSIGVRYGVTLADIDADGDLDIYVAKHDAPNTLFINNGNGTFSERAKQFGLDFCCTSQQATFLDYDRDGDLDMFLARNGDAKGEAFKRDGNPDRLFRNNGNGTFTDVSTEAGIADKGYALSVMVGDYNNDGWADLYVANDFEAPDLLYINNRDGTFTNQVRQWMKHTSIFSMGSDAADFNNDGNLDLFTVDMMPEDHWRKMSHMGQGSVYDPKFDSTQLMRNMLQVNRGDGTFLEVGQLAGIAETDWSWAPLFADFDNDGDNDLFISNGYKRDVQNLDVIHNLNSRSFAPLNVIRKVPSVKLQNYCFRNDGNLTFTKMSNPWGLIQMVNTNGAAVADLDRDGDLDVVMNNIDSVAFIYQNLAAEQKRGNYLQLSLHGADKNTAGVGARVTIKAGGRLQMLECTPVRGYMSSNNAPLHFGLGDANTVDTITIRWPNGAVQTVANVSANQTVNIRQKASAPPAPAGAGPLADTLFWPATAGPEYRHRENRFDDFLRERLLPNRLSRSGPGVAVGDVDGNGLDDVWIGGARSYPGALFLQKESGRFVRSADSAAFVADSSSEDTGALLFDADGDGDLDLYVASGGNEFDTSEFALLQDRLYLNNGSGQFSNATNRLPAMPTSTSSVVAADYDHDGDLDLFVAGRSVPGKYPTAPRSYLLRNDRGHFTDATAAVAPGLAHPGMVTSALWTDFDNDNWSDLILVGEWMPIRFFRNAHGKLTETTSTAGVDSSEGWWNSINGGDVDNDGDVDYVLGNWGLNVYSPLRPSRELPLQLYAADFDGNGSRDLLLSYFFRGSEYPVRGRTETASQLPAFIRRKYPTYTSYATATVDQIYGRANLDSAQCWRARTFVSSVLENLGNGHFQLRPLPLVAQSTPMFGTLLEDFDSDGNLDLLCVGNFDGADPLAVRYNSGYGLYLNGDGKGNFLQKSATGAGFSVPGEGRGLACVAGKDGVTIVAANCNAAATSVTLRQRPLRIDPAKRCTHAILDLGDGRTRRQEWYWGSGYLSQSSQMLLLPSATATGGLYSGEKKVEEIGK
ncbi:MAG: VCBS repeat-containing protein [Candidatus Kapabacteria bacterium]|nr:VCBS repeat-containing protein [Candidatus Kapabacteria bacterium]